ncbi:MAG: NTPase [Pyrobaculum sp.]
MTSRERADIRVGVTGMPGVGKTTLAKEVAQIAQSKYRVCGFLTLEVREGGMRVGFDVVDLNTYQKTPLARIGRGWPSVGKYVVYLDACAAIENALLREPCELVVVDEVGAMEYKCKFFEKILISALEKSPRKFITVHRHYVDVAKRLGFEIFWLTRENWRSVLKTVVLRLGLA